MASELIDNYIDRNGVKGDTDFMLQSLREVYAEFQKLQSVKLDLGKATGIVQSVPILNQAKTGVESLAVAVENVSKQMALTNGSTKELYQNTILYNKASKEAANAAAAEAKALKEAANAKKAESAASAQSAKAKEREAKLVDDAINDYLQLSRAYNEAALKAKNYVLRLGEGNPIAKQAIKDANDLGNVLKKLDASVGQNQRNVGNYASAFNGLGLSFFQVARELPSLAINFQTFALAISNNLPMVADEIGKAKREIAALKAEGKDAPSLFSRITKSIFSFQVGLSVGITLFTLYSKQLLAFFSSIITGSKAFDEAKERTKAYLEALKEVNSLSIKNSAADVAKLELLRNILTDVTKKQKDRNEALKSYNEIADKANQIDASQINNITLVNDKISQQISLVERRALARAAESILADKAEKLLLAKEEARLSAIEETDRNLIGVNASATETQINLERNLTIQRKINSNERVKQAQIEFDETKRALYGLIDVYGFVGEKIESNEKVKKDDSAKKAKEEYDRRLQAQFAIQELELQQQIRFFEALANNENLNIEKRILSNEKFVEKSQKLVELKAELEKKLGTKSKDEILFIEKKKQDDILLLESEGVKKRIKIIADFSAKFSADEKELQAKLAKIAEDGANRFLSDFEKRKSKQKETADFLIEQEKRIKEETSKLYKELYQEISQTVTEFITASDEKRLLQIQNEIDLIDQRKAKEIEVANQTIANRQQLADETIIIEARAQAEKDKLAAQQREIERKKASTERLGQIAAIAGNTAQSVVALSAKVAEIKAQAALLASNPITAGFAPVALANAGLVASQIPIVIGIATAQIARLALPKYKHGKNVNDLYEGPAIVGDGGKKEAIIREDGRVEITDNKPQLTYVKKRDIVLPDANMLANLVVNGHLAIKPVDRQNSQENSYVEMAISRMEKNVVNAIKKIPQPIIKVENMISRRILHGDNTNEYLNKNLQG